MPGQATVAARGLPAAPIDAAAAFHRLVVPQVREQARLGHVAVLFDNADPTHRAWRLAAVQELAREAAPFRVNGVEGDIEGEGRGIEAVSQVLAYLQSADGVTGQVLELAQASD